MINSETTGINPSAPMGWHNLKFDLISAIVVTCVAIPLCLGIALASGVPLFSGLISGIIGGIVVGAISQSRLSVSGPAAGMVTVVAASLAQLGSFEAFLLALLVAGSVQLLIGGLRLGFIADYIPITVIQGLLCAIGLLIAIKQIPLIFGYTQSQFDSVFLAEQAQQDYQVLRPLQHLFNHIYLGPTLIGFISLFILFYSPKIKSFKWIPAPILVIIAGIGINEILKYVSPSLYLDESTFLVNIQTIHTWVDFKNIFVSPAFSAWKNIDVYVVAFTIAAVASLETLLNLEAIEKLDPKKRYCNRNQELVAQGLGNMVAGLVGGLPVTSVIVRSSINLESGARSKFSTIFHGIYLLAAILFLAKWINYIPLASLAAILFYTGCKLSSPARYIAMYKLGFNNFFPFIVTVIAIITTNLLQGTLLGLCVSLFFILKKNSQRGFKIIKEKYPGGNVLHIMFPEQVSFLNKAALITELRSLPANSQVILDGYHVEYMDYDVTEIIKNFITYTAHEKNIAINIEGVKNLPNIKDRTDFMTTTTQSVQEKLTPNDVLLTLIEGNRRFVHNNLIHRNLRYQVKDTASGQHPLAVILSCVDSRVPVEMVFDVGIGDVFCARVAGNIVDEYILASIEFACHVAKAKLILVMGHTSCGAIKAACEHVEIGHISALTHKINHAIQLETTTHENRDSSNDAFLYNVTKLNVKNTLNALYEQSVILRTLIDEETVLLKGCLYDVKTGRVTLV